MFETHISYFYDLIHKPQKNITDIFFCFFLSHTTLKNARNDKDEGDGSRAAVAAKGLSSIQTAIAEL